MQAGAKQTTNRQPEGDIVMPYCPFDYMTWERDGSIGFRDHIPDRTNQKKHKENTLKRRRKAASAAKIARKRNRK